MEAQQLLINVLKQVLIQRLRDDVSMAEDFASEYHDPDNAIGTNQLKTYESYYSLLTNAPSKVWWTEGTDQVSFDSHSQAWSFGLNSGDHTTAHLHEAGHALFTPFNYAGQVASMMRDERIWRIVNIIEDRRIEFLCDLWWQGADVYAYHRADLIRQSAKAWEHFDKAPVYTRNMAEDERWRFGVSISDDMHSDGDNHTRDNVYGDWEPKAVAIAVSLITYDLPGVVYDPVIMKVVENFKEKILDAGCSIDKNAAVRVAVEIANYMDWLNEPDDPDPGEGTESGDTEGTPGDPGQGEGEGQGGGTDDGEGEGQDEGEGGDSDGDSQDGDESGDSEGQGKGEPTDTGDGKGNGRATDATDVTDATPTDSEGSNATTTEESYDSPGGMSGLPTQLDDLLEQALEQAELRHKKQTTEKVLGEIKASTERRPTVSISDHTIELISLRTDTIRPDERVKAMLDSMSDIDYHPRSVMSGTVTPKVWQMRHGNMKVFRQPPKRRGRTLVFVDCSASMGCPCDRCHNKQWKAWMVANAVAKAAGNGELYGFGGGAPTGIGAVPVGHKPACKYEMDAEGTRANHLGNGTPICSALLYAESLLLGSTADTTLVFVTDGEAGHADGCSLDVDRSRRGELCTKDIANRLAESGVDFVAICMGTTAAFPASVVVDLDPSPDTRDIGNLTAAIRHIRNKR